MRQRLVIVMAFVLVVAGLVLGGCQPAEPPVSEEPAAEEPESDEDAIRELADAFSAAWAAGDAATIARFWIEDGDSVTPAGEMVKGRQAIQELYAGLFQGTYKGTRIAIQTQSIRFLAPDVAVADGSYQVMGMTGPDGSELPTVNGLYTNVLVKRGDEWHVVSNRPMIPLAAPSTT